MINSVKVTNYLGESMVMELRNPEKSGFLITSITGISSGKANINTTNIATKDGAYFNSSHIEQRNIVFSIKILPNPTIEEARHSLYRFFQAKRLVRLEFDLDTRHCYIDGYVESNEVEIFSSKESTQISIICPDPFFKDVMDVTEVFSGIDPMFEFEFENESTSESLLEFGEINLYAEKNIIYDGEDEIGLIFDIHATGDVGDIEIWNTITREYMKILSDKIEAFTGSHLIAGDHLYVNTNSGEKSITLIRDGISYNILNCIDRYSSWFKLSNGDNIITYVVTPSSQQLNLNFTATYRPVYGGI